MGFGPLDLFAVFLGPLWLAKEAVKENSEKSAVLDRRKQIEDYINEHTNKELELEVKEFIDNPDNYDTVYKYLEGFKKENPDWCREHERPIEHFRGREWGDQAWYKEDNIGNDSLDWYNVGLERVNFFGGKSDYEYRRRRDNRNRALAMIMEIFGYATVAQAKFRAEENILKSK